MSITHFAKGMLDTLTTFTYLRVLDRPFILILACISLFLLWWFLLPFCHDQLLLLLFYRDLLLGLRASKWRRSRFTLRSTRIDIGQIARCVDAQRAQDLCNSTIYRQEQAFSCFDVQSCGKSTGLDFVGRFCLLNREKLLK